MLMFRRLSLQARQQVRLCNYFQSLYLNQTINIVNNCNIFCKGGQCSDDPSSIDPISSTSQPSTSNAGNSNDDDEDGSDEDSEAAERAAAENWAVKRKSEISQVCSFFRKSKKCVAA